MGELPWWTYPFIAGAIAFIGYLLVFFWHGLLKRD